MAILSYANTVGQKPSIREALIMNGVKTAPLVEMLKSKSINSFVHSWLTDRYRDPKDNARLEISSVGETPKDTKKKTTNHCQIIINEIKVSKRAEDVAQYSGNELNRQIAKVGAEHIKDIEYAMLGLGQADVFNAPVAMSDTTPAKMAGFFYFVPNTNKIDAAGAEFTLDELHKLIEPVWKIGGIDNGNFKILMGSLLKGKVNTWIKENNALKIDVKDNKLDPRITRIATDFGEVDIVLHRLFAGDKLKDKVLLGNFDEATLCYLRDTEIENVSTDETATIKRYYTDVTLEVANADYFASGSGYKVK